MLCTHHSLPIVLPVGSGGATAGGMRPHPGDLAALWSASPMSPYTTNEKDPSGPGASAAWNSKLGSCWPTQYLYLSPGTCRLLYYEGLACTDGGMQGTQTPQQMVII